MNQKDWLVDTGANIAAFASPQAGMHAYCTASGSGFVAGQEYYHDGSSWKQRAAPADALVYPYSTTLSDYLVLGSVFSDDFSSYATQGAADAVWVPADTAKMRVNITNDNINAIFVADNSNDAIFHDIGRSISDTQWKLRLKIRWSAKTTSNSATFVLSDSSGASNTIQDAIGILIIYDASIKQYGSVDVDGGALPMTGFDSAVNFDPTLSVDYFFEIERTSATSYVVRRYSDSTYTTVSDSAVGTCAATCTGLRFIKIANRIANISGGQTVTVDDLILFEGGNVTHIASSTNGTNTPAKVNDNDTTSRWESHSEINPWLRLEISAASDKEPAAIALYPHTNTTVTQIKIQISSDGTNWTDKRLISVSALSIGEWNYIRFNRGLEYIRYIRIYGNDISAKVLAISEVRVLLPTELQWNRRHGHQLIPETDAAIPIDA